MAVDATGSDNMYRNTNSNNNTNSNSKNSTNNTKSNDYCHPCFYLFALRLHKGMVFMSLQA